MSYIHWVISLNFSIIINLSKYLKEEYLDYLNNKGYYHIYYDKLVRRWFFEKDS